MDSHVCARLGSALVVPRSGKLHRSDHPRCRRRRLFTPDNSDSNADGQGAARDVPRHIARHNAERHGDATASQNYGYISELFGSERHKKLSPGSHLDPPARSPRHHVNTLGAGMPAGRRPPSLPAVASSDTHAPSVNGVRGLVARLYHHRHLHPWTVFGSLVLVWLFIGAAGVQHNIERCDSRSVCRTPTYSMALYFSVQAGLSVGFGLLSEKETAYRLVTVLHGFIGLTFYTWAFQIYFHPERVARRANARWEHWEMHEVQKAQGVCKALLTALLRHRKSINRGLAVVLWLGVGMVFEACYNGWSFVKAFYFAFFALSTGGLQAPRSIGRDRQLETTQ